MLRQPLLLLAVTLSWITGLFPVPAARGQEVGHFYAARGPRESGETWGLLDRDGANRTTERYLSSLVGGEPGTGSIGSPPFVLHADAIRFTIRGHDGPQGGRGANYIALVDNKTGNILRQTSAPGNDALQERQWEVAELKGRTVRISVVDGIAEGAYAWLGVEQIDAGPEMNIDFRQVMPDGWQSAGFAAADDGRRTRDVLAGPVPFRTFEDAYTWVPETGTAAIPIGAAVERLYVLGCNVPASRVLIPYGHLDIVYADGARETYDLVLGFNLEGTSKLASGGEEVHVRPVGDGTQSMLAIEPESKPVQRVELRRAAGDLPRPRISAITCQTRAQAAGGSAESSTDSPLDPLPAPNASAEDLRWIASHTLRAGGTTWKQLAGDIRRARGLPSTLAEIQRLEEPAAAKFTRRKLSDRPFEAASVCDVDGDGRPDIVSGDFWYPGPEFAIAVQFREVEAAGGYHDAFHDYPLDVNGDGRVDVVSGGWTGGTLRWYENPGGERAPRRWTVHEIDKPGPIETSRFWDVTGDGHVEIVPNAGGNVVVYPLVRDASGRGAGRFEKHTIKSGGCGHGIGCGDVNGDGRSDLVIPEGWLEAPEKPLADPWALHAEFQLGAASVPILVHDVNQDGRADLIYGQAHGYGLYWLEQGAGDQGQRVWAQHLIDDQSSQYHDLALADIDGDGQLELVTGKRYYAHNGHDPGAEDPVFVRYFDIGRDGVFTPHTIDFGPAGQASGVGIYFWVEDVNGDKRPDIVAPGKEGLYLFLNRESVRHQG